MRFSLFVLATALSLSPIAVASEPFNNASFAATHNSYEGGTRGSIVQQLDRGVRFVEFDIHVDDFASIGDYRIGHESPGDRVMRGGGTGNPDDLRLRAWLRVVREWSDAHPHHAPITLTLDVKNDLAHRHSFADGNLPRLNQELREAFAEKLFPALEL